MWSIFTKGVNWVENSWRDTTSGLWSNWDYFTLRDTAFIITLIVADLDDLSGILGFHFLSENNATFDLKKDILNFSEFRE